MSLGGAKRQTTRQLELPLGNRGEAPKAQRSGEALMAASETGNSGTDQLLERVVERSNVRAALKRVRQNKGSPGVDGMSVDELPAHLVEHGRESASGCSRVPTSRSRCGKWRYRRATVVSAS